MKNVLIGPFKFLWERPKIAINENVHLFYLAAIKKIYKKTKRVPVSDYWEYKWSLERDEFYEMPDGEGCLFKNKFFIPGKQ